MDARRRAEHRHTATCPWPVRDDPYRTWTYVRPGAPEDPVTEAERAAWVEEEPFIRAGLRPQTQRALAYIARFRATRARPLRRLTK